jgi:hypothetical protein
MCVGRSAQANDAGFHNNDRYATEPTIWMGTHRFNHPNDTTQGGGWFGERGRRLCDWSWGATTKTVKVTRYMRRKRTDLINIGEQLLTPAELRDKLPQLALEAAQRVGKERG